MSYSQVIVEKCKHDKSFFKKLRQLKGKSIVDTSSGLAKNEICIVNDLISQYGGWDWFYIVEVEYNATFMEEEITPFNVITFAAQKGLTLGIAESQILVDGPDMHCVIPVHKTIPIIGGTDAKHVFVNARAALEVVSTKGSMENGKVVEPIKVSAAQECEAKVDQSVLIQNVDLIKSVKTTRQPTLEMASELNEKLKKVPTLDLQKRIHSNLIVPYYVAVHDQLLKKEPDTASEEIKKFFTGDVGSFEETKAKMIPVKQKRTVSSVSKFLANSRTYRGKDGNGFSGYSSGYAYGVLMKKNHADMLDQIQFLRFLRTLYLVEEFHVYNMQAEAILYSYTNVPGPITYITGMSIDSAKQGTNGVHQVRSNKMSTSKDIVIDFKVEPLKYPSSLDDPGRAKVFWEYFDSSIKGYGTTYFKAMEFADSRDYKIFPLRSTHNMIVMCSNVKMQPGEVFDIQEYLHRVYISNFVRNNWFYYNGRLGKCFGAPDKVINLAPPLKLAKKELGTKSIAFEFESQEETVLDQLKVENNANLLASKLYARRDASSLIFAPEQEIKGLELEEDNPMELIGEQDDELQEEVRRFQQELVVVEEKPKVANVKKKQPDPELLLSPVVVSTPQPLLQSGVVTSNTSSTKALVEGSIPTTSLDSMDF